MGVAIPSMRDYHFKNGKYVLKSKFNKWFRVGLMIGFALGSILSISSTASDQGIGTWGFYRDKYVDFIQNVNPNLSDKDARGIVVSAFKWGDYFKLDPRLILAIVKVESGFNKYAISGAGAMGLMQVMVKVHTDKIVLAKNVAGSPEIFDTNSNIFIGTKILKDCQDKFANKSLACYNGSMGTDKYHNKVMAAYQSLQSL